MSKTQPPTESTPTDRLNCPPFKVTPRESGAIWLLWWRNRRRSKALLEPTATDDVYQVGIVFDADSHITYQHGDPYTGDPTRDQIHDTVLELVEQHYGITVVDEGDA